MSEDVIATCREIEAEILRVLTDKFAWESTRARAALDAVLARTIRVQLHGTVKECRDPNDDMFLECAMRAKADLLIAMNGLPCVSRRLCWQVGAGRISFSNRL